MKEVRDKITYANVVSTLALFLVLAGGSAFAASRLGANSVKTRQIGNGAVTAVKIKNGAVTPVKLSAASKAALSGPAGAPGAVGPRGEQGVQGPQGEPGPRGERGPGAISLEAAATSTLKTVATFDGIEVMPACDSGGSAQIDLQMANEATRFEVFGTSSDGVESKVFAVNFRTYGLTFIGAGSEHMVTLDLDARPSGVSAPWTQLDLHLDAVECELTGTVIESQMS